MKVIGFNASPRKNGNTVTLVKSVLKGAKGRGAKVKLVNLRELEMKGCIACEGCKKELGKCLQKDDLSPILKDLVGYDAIVLGTPVYWFHVTAQLKMLTDRFYCYFREEIDPKTGETTFESIFPGGKKFVVVTSRGDVEPATLFPELYEQLTGWLKLVGAIMGASSTELVTHYGSLNEKGSAKKDAALIAKAECVGASLVG